MRILYIYRHPAMGFSIGKVFRQIEEEMRKYAEVDAVYMPVPNYSLKGLLKNILAAKIAVRKKHYDIVHITGAEHYLIPFLHKQKVVVTVHDLGFCNFLPHKISYYLKYLLFVMSLKKASLVTFISTSTEKETLEKINLEQNQYITIHDPLGKEFKEFPKFFNKESPVILHIGTKKNKNLDRSIEALKGIKCRLRIIGKINERTIQRLSELNVSYTVKTGLTDQELLEEYQGADIINFPSLYEGFGMPIIEGQAVGRIVVTSDIEPMRSVAGSNCALFVNPYSCESIHNAYLDAINDDTLRETIINNAKKNILNYKVEDIVLKYYNRYLSLLKIEC